MRSALYLENGYTQVVLTPENDFEKAALRAIETSVNELSVKRGEFYHCQGGWAREAYWSGSRASYDSLMLIVQPKAPEPEPAVVLP